MAERASWYAGYAARSDTSRTWFIFYNKSVWSVENNVVNRIIAGNGD